MFPSLHRIVDEASQAFRRFPFAVLFGALWAFCLSWSIFLPYDAETMRKLLHDLLLAGYLGMLGGIFFPLLGESHSFRSLPPSLLHGIPLLLFLLYFFFLPANPYDAYPQRIYITYALWVLALHFGIAIAPFIGVQDDDRFWQYNKALFLRILTSALYSGVLFIGISIALLTIDGLFGLHIDGEYYGVLGAILAGLFNTWFFVAGIPERARELDPEAPYPIGLKRFTQYVLLPLVTIYLAILYGYMIKVMLQGEIPEGITAYLVLAFSIAGILALLLLYPIQEREEGRWVRLFSKWFHVSLFPVILLLGFAIFQRVLQYGITENRYFVIVLALWLTGIALYFSVRRKPRIRMVPLSLFLLALFISLGPWGASYVSERAQLARFESKFREMGALDEDDRLPPSPSGFTIDHETADELRSIVEYLLRTHGPRSIDPYFTQGLRSMFRKDSLHHYHQRTQKVMELLTENAEKKEGSEDEGVRERTGNLTQERPIGGKKGMGIAPYDRVYHLDISFRESERIKRVFRKSEEEFYHLWLRRKGDPHLRMELQDSSIFELDLLPLMKDALDRGHGRIFSVRMPLDSMSYPKDPEQGGWAVVIERLRFHYFSEEGDPGRIEDLDARVYLKGGGEE